MQDLSKTFPNVTFPQWFCVDCTQHIVTVMLSQTYSVCYDCNAVLSSLEMCVLNTQICIAGKITCWSEWASWLSSRSVNKTAILLTLKVIFLSSLTSSHSLPCNQFKYFFTSFVFILIVLVLFDDVLPQLNLQCFYCLFWPGQHAQF